VPESLVRLLGRAPERVVEIEETLAALAHADQLLARAQHLWPGNEDAKALADEVLLASAHIAGRENQFALAGSFVDRLAPRDPAAASAAEAAIHEQAFGKDGPLCPLWFRSSRVDAVVLAALCFMGVLSMGAPVGWVLLTIIVPVPWLAKLLLVVPLARYVMEGLLLVLPVSAVLVPCWLAGWCLREGSATGLRLARGALVAALCLLAAPTLAAGLVRSPVSAATCLAFAAAVGWFALVGARRRVGRRLILKAIVAFAVSAAWGAAIALRLTWRGRLNLGHFFFLGWDIWAVAIFLCLELRRLFTRRMKALPWRRS
jgi:hypothetical protein